MLSLSDHRQSKGFTGRFKHIIKDPNQGIDYASTLKYKKEVQDFESEQRKFAKSLIQSIKNSAEVSENFGVKDSEVSIDIIKNVTSQHSDKIMGNPLIGAILKNQSSSKKGIKQEVYSAKNFSKTSDSFYKPFKKSAEHYQAHDSYRVIVKNFKAAQQKQFVKYPSSSLLYSNPLKYKEKAQIQDHLMINSDSEQEKEQNKLKSSFGGFEKSKQFLRVPSKNGKKRHISLPTETNTAYCSLKNKYFKEKSFFNNNIVFLKKKKKDLAKPFKVKLNDQAENQERQKFTSEKIHQTQKQSEDDPFSRLIKDFQRKSSQSKMSRENYENSLISNFVIQQNKQISSKLYMKCWSSGKKSEPSYISKVKELNLTGFVETPKPKRLATQLTVFKKPQVPKLRLKKENSKVKTVI